MNFLEKDLEQIIFETDNKLLVKKGLNIDGHKKRQLRIGNYGVADICTWYKSYEHEPFDPDDMPGIYILNSILNINVFELKKDKIDANTMMQAFRYCKGIKRYIKNERNLNMEIRFHISLIGKSICEGSFIYIPDFADAVNLYTYSYEFDGIKFKKHNGYYLINEGF